MNLIDLQRWCGADSVRAWMCSLLAAALLGPLPMCAQTRVSTHYELAPETEAAGAGEATSPAYALTHVDGLFGVSFSGSASSDYTLRMGFPGSLVEYVGISIEPLSLVVPEGQARPLSAQILCDDGTSFDGSGRVTWSVVNGPVVSVSPAGLVLAGIVYQDTAAKVQAALGPLSQGVFLTVLEALPDNFPPYAADGLPDGWQVQYFGLNSDKAGPELDPDRDGLSNRYEYVAGLNPTDPSSILRVSISDVPAQPGWKAIQVSPTVPGRIYTLLASDNLALPSFVPLTGYPQVDQGNAITLMDTNATTSMRFYRVAIAVP